MRIVVPREDAPAEKRVPIVPESVKRLVAKKIEVTVEAGAGDRAHMTDEEYKAAGAEIEVARTPTRSSASASRRPTRSARCAKARRSSRRSIRSSTTTS